MLPWIILPPPTPNCAIQAAAGTGVFPKKPYLKRRTVQRFSVIFFWAAFSELPSSQVDFLCFFYHLLHFLGAIIELYWFFIDWSSCCGGAPHLLLRTSTNLSSGSGFNLRVQPSGSAFGFSLRAQPLGPRKHDARWERKRWFSWSFVQMWIFWLFDTKQSSGEWCYLECSEHQLIRQSKCVPKTRNSKNTLNHNFLRAKKRAFVITFISKGECLRVHSNRDSEKWHRKGYKNMCPLEECKRGTL